VLYVPAVRSPFVLQPNLVSIFLLAASVTAHAQEPAPGTGDYLVHVWDTDSGLPHSTVTSVAQTPDGYLWVGTLHGGLARFDGTRFVNFHPGNTPELRSVEVQRLLVDREGTLWVGFVEGSLFSYRNGQFHFEMSDPRTPGGWLSEVVACDAEHIVLSSRAGWLFRATRRSGTNGWETLRPPDADGNSVFCEDRQGVVWYRTGDAGLAQWRDGRFARLPALPGLKSQQINALARDAAGRIWVGTEKGIAFWDQNAFVSMTPTNGEPEFAVRQMSFCADGGVWVRTDGRLRKALSRRWLAEAKPWDDHFGPSPRPLAMFGDAHGGVWLSHYGSGLWQVDEAGQVARIGEEQGLPSGLVGCWFEDHEGNIWAGPWGGGLVRLRKRAFHLVWPAELQPERVVQSVCEDRGGAIWLGTSEGALLSWRNGVFRDLAPPVEANWSRDCTVCPEAAGGLWVGTVHNGVWLLEDGQFRRPFPSSAVHTVARALCVDHKGQLWVGSEYGLFCWQTNSLTRFSAKEGFGPGYVLSIAEAEEGDLWVGMANAELRHLRNGRFEHYGLQGGGGDIRFWALLPETNGVVWIGTLGGGLLRFQHGDFTRYTTDAGLPNEHVSQILADGRGQLWLGTRAGIARVNKEALEQFAAGRRKSVPFVTYGKFDGLPSTECSGGFQPGCWRGQDGRLWFTTVKGVVWTRPDEVPSNPLPPPVHIEEVWVDGQRVQPANHPVADNGRPGGETAGTVVTRGFEVGGGRHYLEFHFAALSFTAPDKIRFRWRLGGLERDWVEGGDKRSVSYSFLPPGDYRFQVRACNNDGVWNEAGDALALKVLPYFWQTWWFRLGCTSAALALLGLAYSVRVARIRALERMRLRIARDLHDEVGANLASIALLAQVMEKQPAPADASLIRNIASQTVDTLRDIVWFIDPAHDRLADLVTRMNETASAMLQRVPYHFEQRGDMRSGPLPLEFRRNVLPIFKEALHNALKHAQATEVHILVQRSAGLFEFRVCDNGQGFQEGSRYPGNGLKNMRRRAADLGGQLEITSRPGHGCAIQLTVALTQMRDW